MGSAQEIWLGYSSEGTRATLNLDRPESRVLLLGSSADEIAALYALASKDAGAKPIIFDLGGYVAHRLSGRFETFDYRSFLYDSFRLDSPEHWHSQLVAAAYSAALDLTSEEESIINSALQKVASEGSLASPAALYDIIGAVEGFRGFYVDKLKGRIGSIRLFDAVDDQGLGRLNSGNVIVDFHRAPYPQAAELAASLFLAKLLSLAHATGSTEGVLILTEAHRMFKSAMRFGASSRLLSCLLDSRVPTCFSSDQQQALSRQLIDACPVFVYSSDAWHRDRGPRDRVLPGALVLLDNRTGSRRTFLPRRVISKSADYFPEKPAGSLQKHIAEMILEEVERFPLSTRESVIQFLAPEFLPADINMEMSNLVSEQYLISEPKDSGSGPRIFALTVTEKGKKFLRGAGR